MKYAYISDRGRERENNEDFVLINEELSIFILADGMGGHSAGEVASEEACYFVMDYIFKNSEMLQNEPLSLFNEAIEAANDYIWEKAKENPNYNGMGTTMVLLHVKDRDFYIANIGDSRAYKFSKGVLSQITKDHSWIQNQIDKGRINEENAKMHPYRNVITRSIGLEKAVYKPPQFIEGKLEDGEIIMLCSDGLHDYVDMDVVSSYIDNYDMDEAAEMSVKLANDEGGRDNCSLVLYRA